MIMGVVYLLHFEKKYKHAQHYIGYTDDLDKRIKKHRKGDGARLVEVFAENGIDFVIARVWQDKDRNFERRLKNQKSARKLCPLCRKERLKHEQHNKTGCIGGSGIMEKEREGSPLCVLQ